MSVYFIGDLHFGHKNIQKFRHFVESPEHNEDLISNYWKEKITKKDVVYLMGDVAFTEEGLRKVHSLPGRKILVRGNHDLLPTKYLVNVFEDIYGIVKYKEFWLSHAPIHPDELRGKVNIHGHVHYQTIPDVRYFNTSVENLIINFAKPMVELDELRKHLNERTVP